MKDVEAPQLVGVDESLRDGKLVSPGERNLCKEYAEKGALFVDACRDCPKTGTGKMLKRMMKLKLPKATKSYQFGSNI